MFNLGTVCVFSTNFADKTKSANEVVPGQMPFQYIGAEQNTLGMGKKR